MVHHWLLLSNYPERHILRGDTQDSLVGQTEIVNCQYTLVLSIRLLSTLSSRRPGEPSKLCQSDRQCSHSDRQISEEENHYRNNLTVLSSSLFVADQRPSTISLVTKPNVLIDVRIIWTDYLMDLHAKVACVNEVSASCTTAEPACNGSNAT